MFAVAIPIIFIGVIAALIFHVIYSDRKYKEIEVRGKPIKGRVVKIKYFRDKFFMKTGKCNLIVSFEMHSEQKTLRTLSALDDYKYSVGDEIDLLYIEEYPKLIIVDGVPSLTKSQMTITIVVLVAIAVFIGVMSYDSYVKHRRTQNTRAIIEELQNLSDVSQGRFSRH